MKNIPIVLCCLLVLQVVKAQHILKPGFDAKEYLQMLDVFEMQNSDTLKKRPVLPSLAKCEFIYQSGNVGMYNRFDVWKRSDNVGIICIRGTIGKPESWMENFYCAMIPATGSLQLSNNTVFNYKLAADSTAKVAVGWTVGLGFMAPLMIGQIKNLYNTGVREIIIIGHSQGGALAFLTRSFLEYCPDVPKDIHYKTYASAPPKPGNMYYAYDLDYITRGGWALRVSNSADWVPETPFSIQTLNELNPANPLVDIEKLMGRQKFFIRWYVNSMFRKLDRSSRKAMKRYQKYLGTKVSILVKRYLKEYKKPQYANSMNYMTAGTPVILMANDAYKSKFIYDGKNIFVHHVLGPYRFLVNAIYP